MKTAIRIVIGVIVLCVLISINHPKAPEPEPYRLPSIMEVQETLIAEGFNIEADGILGKETQRAWNAYDTGLKQWWDESGE